MRRLVIPLAAVAVAVPLAAGCGGGGGGGSSTTTSESGKPSGEWANGFCQAFNDWTASLKGISSSLQTTPTKENLKASGSKIKSANDQLANDLKALGKPAVSGGDQAKDVVNTLADQVKSDSEKVTTAVADVSSVSDIVNAAAVTSTALLDLQTQVKDALSQLKTLSENKGNDLKDAFANAAACTSLQSSSG